MFSIVDTKKLKKHTHKSDLENSQASRESEHVTEDVQKRQVQQSVSLCFELTSECFFLEDKSRVVSYKLSTKFLRHGTFTSFFTA